MNPKGDKKAIFDKLFREQYSSLVYTAIHILGDQTKSEDIVQDLFVDLWRKEQTLDDVSFISAYLKKSTQYKCFDFLRKQKRIERNKSILQENDTVSHTISPEDDYISNEKVQHIKTIINQLPDKGRAIFMMSRYDEMTYKEIAEVLQISLKTVEYHMSQNLKFLRESIFSLLFLLFF